jgi:alanine racemase
MMGGLIMKKTIAPTWVEVNLDNLRFNLAGLRKLIKKDVKVCCVLKADSYSCGSVEVAEALEKENVDYFAVAKPEEGLELRHSGVATPILVLGYITEGSVREAISLNLTFTVYSYDTAVKIDEVASSLGLRAKVHVKIDSGMNRIGFKPTEESIEDIVKISKLKNIELEGLYTHFATADETDKTKSKMQLKNYLFVVYGLKARGVSAPIEHVSNSAATIDLPEANFNMVRPGIMLYGHYPSEEVFKDRVELKPVLKFKSTITNIKTIEKGDGISYGFTYTAEKTETIATVAVGYADGFTRIQKNPKILIKGEMCDVVGRICMDQLMVRIDKDLDIKVGDEVILFGEGEATAERIAKDLGTINYEVLCMISRRVDRVYMENNRIAKVTSYLLK